ncbi:MAG TPA: hydrogenase large subunit, partial [Pyrodictium sp.]|nr:hydrogenase large subunit [Pyrodictium sp.]
MNGEAPAYDLVKEYIERLKKLVPPDAIVDVKVKGKDKVYVEVKREYLPEVLEKVYWELGGYLSSMAGTDDRNIDSHFRLYYIVSIEEGIRHIQWKPWIIVYTKIPWDDPKFKSTTPKVPAASWYEREVKDLLGLEPIGHPDPRRLALPDDWPEGLYPMRKDFKFYERPPRQ